MTDFQLDARKWRFLDKPNGYDPGEVTFKKEPLKRQFKTAKEVLWRFKEGCGVLLADDVGLGKTTVGALVAWVVACQGKRVRIYAPNEVLRRHWAEELERHVPMLRQFGASDDCIKQGKVQKLEAGRIQVTTHDALVKFNKSKKEKGNNRQKTSVRGPTNCDLMIVDEAHRAKGENSAFNKAITKLGVKAVRKLILTATPFSIDIGELEQMLRFVGATKFKQVRQYATDLKWLYSLGDGYDVTVESKRLVSTARAAIEELQPHLIRHGIDDLSSTERKHFGALAQKSWEIPTAPATQEDLALLLRMDRLLQLTPERKGERRNDPRFHIGWQHVGTELERASDRARDPTARRHIEAASKALRARRTKPHPKIAAVSDAIRPRVDAGEKVLVFCHHRATASEVLGVLEGSLKQTGTARVSPPERVWRAAWESLTGDWSQLGLKADDKDCEKKKEQNARLLSIVIGWFCTTGLRAQIAGWVGEPALTVEALADQLTATRPRNAKSSVPTVLESARTLTEVLLDQQSTSTRALLKSIAKGTQTFGGKTSHFPGRLNDGFRVMGAWDHGGERNKDGVPLDGNGSPLETLYTRKPDIVLALFNSPFGPDVLVTTDRLSEGVDLHRCCRHLIHYELDPSPVRTLQRNGRVRRVGSWASLTGQPIEYAYPTFGGTRDEKAVSVMRQRINAFGLLLGGVPSLDDDSSDSERCFAEDVLRSTAKALKSINRKLGVMQRN